MEKLRSENYRLEESYENGNEGGLLECGYAGCASIERNLASNF